MKYLLILFILFLIPLVFAETTFFDNPNDAFIMGNSSATPTADSEITGGTTDELGCLYKWNCTNWSECLPSGKQTRNCTNFGTCPNKYKSPEIEENCIYIGKENAYKNKLITYFIIILIILSITVYLNKDYFKKLF